MTVYIMDPGLTGMSGHHARWDAEFAKVFRKRGHETYVLSHNKFTDREIGGAQVIQHFQRTIWHVDDKTQLMRNWDLFHDYNPHIEMELTNLFKNPALRGKTLCRDDLVIFPTILQFQLLGAINWFNKLPDDERPTMLCYLMGPSGCLLDRDKKQFIAHSIDTARFYTLAFRAAKAGKGRVHFFANGEDQAEQYSTLMDKKISACPLLNSAIQSTTPPRETANKKVLLHVGDPRNEKGFSHLRQIVKHVCPRHSDWEFTIHLGKSRDSLRSGTHVFEAFVKIQELLPNLRFLEDRLDDAAYCALFNDSEIVVTPYCPEYYFNQSSGILWEAVATANSVIVPQNSWLEREAYRLGASFETFERFDVGPICDAISRMISNPPLTRKEKIDKALAFKSRNHLSQLEAQIFDVWDPGKITKTG